MPKRWSRKRMAWTIAITALVTLLVVTLAQRVCKGARKPA